MKNDTPVFDAMAFNPSTVSYDIWKGVGTREAIKAAGFRVADHAPVYYCLKGITKRRLVLPTLKRGTLPRLG